MIQMTDRSNSVEFGGQSLVTWIDVARRLSSLEPKEIEWRTRPSGLRAARVDWRGATFILLDLEERFAVLEWLSLLFPRRVEHANLILDGPEHSNRLPIEFEKEDWLERRPRLNLGAVESDIDFLDVAEHEPPVRPLPLIACHSVKGGTGRTISAIATALSWARREKRAILLVDADIEAPGISYMFRSARREVQASLEDLVAMAHADPSPDRRETAQWIANRLRDHKLGDLVVLPLRRDLDELASSSIRAEHLASPDRPYAFADLLVAVAERLQCAGVVVDVRAGLVPLAAQLVLDPGVSRLVVTSLSGQSLEATHTLMRFVSRELRRTKTTLVPPLLVVNRVPTVLRELGQDDRLLGPILDQITADLLLGYDREVNADEPVLQEELEITPLRVVKIPEIADLQVTSSRLSDYIDQVELSGFLRRLEGDLEAWLSQDVAKEVGRIERDYASNTVSARGSSSSGRTRLRDFAGRLVAAETADHPVETPLVTRPMLALAKTFAGQLPIVISEGAKGTGKTLTARFLVAKGSWRAVVSQIAMGTDAVHAPILPVLGSIQASERFLVEIDRRRSEVSKWLAVEVPQRVGDTRSALCEKLQSTLSGRQWTDLWLDVIAWSAGVGGGEAGAGTRFLDRLRNSSQQILCIIEGIEELHESANDPAVIPMLRALLLDLPVRLRSEPGRPLGLIVFARRDTVDAGVVQNREQFRANYADFALTWTEGDVLELAAWLATQADALQLWGHNFGELPDSIKAGRLEPLWGRKLGRDEKPGERIREAYTAGWVIAALSDLQGRLVARDLVRFLYYAAASPVSSDDSVLYGSRLLVPRALKEAIGQTSEKKVTETEEEIRELQPTFAKFRARSGEVIAPIDEDAVRVLDLNDRDIERLQRHGIIFGDAPPYEVPELFRMGLKLRHGGARHSVLNLRRRARQRLANVI
jgi:MinD-like ATPase involved in chromosome partitioning or flagellar assembly